MGKSDFASERDLSNSSEGAPGQGEGDGTLVLEQLARIGAVDEFMAAADVQDFEGDSKEDK